MTEVIAKEALKTAESRPVRLPVQKRGQQRVEAILDAAELVLSEIGVDAATTNAIADRAGASVGSLYHFFPNKSAILAGLADRYSATATAILRRERRIEDPSLPLDVLFTQMIDAFTAMGCEHPGYMAFCRATDAVGGGKSQASLQADRHKQELVQELIMHRCPGMPADEAAVHAALSVVTMHAALDHMLAVEEPLRSGLRSALVALMVRYFTPIESRYTRAPRAG
ncbi:MAG: TetR/AcrR family transcriptional regulator [Gemmatimonadaceae bacterium]|nr:TetR/AcrR family transcriptional regulator [Gemmatimonadaceae bacterium]